MSRPGAAVGVWLALALAAAAPAAAGTASVRSSDNTLSFEAAPGEANRVVLSPAPAGAVRLVDDGATVTPGPGCAPAADGRGVVCAAPEWGLAGVSAQLGDGDDFADARELAGRSAEVWLSGDEGEDELHAAPSGWLDDHDPQVGPLPNLVGGPGDDLLVGGPAGDYLNPGPGADVLRGGPGRDRVSYAGSTAGVVITLDDRPGDGPAGENDDVGADVEMVGGSRGDDLITGSAGSDTLEGFAGADVLDGRGGPDLLITGPGGDRLIGGPGADVFDAEIHPTRVEAGDGERDRVGCGVLVTMLSFDPLDSLSECAPPAARPLAYRLRVRRDRTLGLLLGCGGQSDIPCAGKILVRRETGFGYPSGPVIGRGRFRVPADGSATRATVRFTRSFMRLLTGRRKIAAEAALITLRERPRSSRTVPMYLELLAPR